MRRSRHTEFRMPKLLCTSPISVAIGVSLGEVTTTLNLPIDLAEEVVKSLFLFIALASILINVAESFEQFW